MVWVNQLVSFTIVRAEGIAFRLCRRPGGCLNRQNPQIDHAEEVERLAVHGVMECDRTAVDMPETEERYELRQGPDGRSEGGEAPERWAWTESNKN